MFFVHAVAGLAGLVVVFWILAAFLVVFAIASDNWVITGILASAFVADRLIERSKRT